MNILQSNSTANGANVSQGLAKYAGLFSLVGLAVSAVVVGEFSGWNHGLLDGGFGGMLIATLLVILMYACLCISMAELSTAMPFAGGAYGFARAALGPWGGLFAGLSQIMEYQFALSTIVVAIGIEMDSILSELFGLSFTSPILWCVIIVVFLLLNSWDTKLFFRSAIILAIAPIAVLGVFWYLAIPQFDIQYLLSVDVASGVSNWLPKGLMGIAWAMPFAIWFFLSIEVVSLAAEETHQPRKNIPRALFWSFAILACAALLTLVLNAGIPPGASVIGGTESPLLTGFQTLLGSKVAPAVLILFIMIGSMASFHSTIYAAGRALFSFSRAGYLPKVLAKTSVKGGTPYIALLVVGVLTFVLASVALFFSKKLSAIALLLNMSVLSAITSYVFTLLSFVILRYRYPKMHRPYVSPLGVTGAITGLLIAFITLILMFTNAGYQLGLLGCLVIFIVGGLFFAMKGKTLNQNAPEEAFAEALHVHAPKSNDTSDDLAGEML